MAKLAEWIGIQMGIINAITETNTRVTALLPVRWWHDHRRFGRGGWRAYV